MADQSLGRGKFASLLLLLQGLLLILFVVFVGYDESLLPSTKDKLQDDSKFIVFDGLHVMVFVGFGFLMTFLKKYGFSALGYNVLISALVIEWSTIMQGFFKMKNNKFNIGIDSMIHGDLTAVAVLITMGANLGKTSHLQLLIIAFIEVIFYSVNQSIGTRFLQAVDAGGCMFVHTFGAYFGLAVARVLYNQKVVAHDKETSRYTSDLFAMLGTIFLWICWPSFNAALVDGVARQRAIVNTYYAIVSSCITSCAFSSFVTKASKLSMVHLQNASLAGGVAVGTIAPMIIQPWGAVLIGFVSGALSTTGFKYIQDNFHTTALHVSKTSPYSDREMWSRCGSLHTKIWKEITQYLASRPSTQPWLIRRLFIHDTCGVNSLHGLPGILGALAGTISSGIASYSQYSTSLYKVFPARAPVFNSTQYLELIKFDPNAPEGLGRSAGKQAAFQFAALVLTLALAIIGGLLTGVVVKQSFFDPLTDEALYDDGEYWEVPSDFSVAPPETALLPKTSCLVENEPNELDEPIERSV